MGGVAGHMDHLYDNRDLTFGEMKEIIRAAANAELTAEEKVDGQNLFISYSVPEGKAKGARNKGNLKAGGLDASGLAKKFAGRGGLEKAFTGGFDAFEKAVESLSDKEKIKAFGPDANIWYNSEVMDPGTEGDPNDPGSINVIKYDNKTLKIHGVGHFVFNKETGEKEPIPEGSLEVIDNALERMQAYLGKTGSKYKLARQAIINLQKLENEEVLSSSIALINRQMADNGLNDSSTMEDYMFTRLLNGMESELPDDTRREIVNYLMKLPGNIGLRALKKGLSQEDLYDLNSVIAAKKSLLLQAIEPLENIIHDFAVALLRGLNSVFIADNDKEVIRLKEELAQAVREITARGSEDPAAMEVMQRHLNKIKDFSQITTPVEAIVFDYNGHTYKFSGNFAPLNQILGMFKYGMGTKPMLSSETPAATNESIQSYKNILTEDEDNIKREKAKQFVLSLPKFVPTEAWGDPKSMERQQIQKIFDTVGGGATIQEKLTFLNDSINNPKGGIRSPRRIISTLILLESVKAVVESFGEAPAGFVFEGFMAGLLRGQQVAGRTEKGNLPIQDLIAFSELEGGKAVPVSLKLLKGLAPGKKGKITDIEGSYTNLIDALEEFGLMVYIVGRKDGEKIVLEKFTFTRDNFIDALITGGKGGLVKEADLFLLPGMNRKQSLNKIRSAENWGVQYELLQQTAGYDPKERARKLSNKEKEEKVAITDEVPDGEDIQPDAEPANKKEYQYSVAECRKMWDDLQLINESLLTESSQRQWSISPSQLKKIAPMVDYEALGFLPYSSDRIVNVAVQYMDFLSDNLQRVFDATSKLADSVNNYFTYRKRSDAIGAGQNAIDQSKIVADEMSQQVTKDSSEPGRREDITESESSGKRIALFPGKFKPPHRGHFDYVNQIAKRSDVDEVIILISPVDFPEVTNEQSLAIWKEYLKNGEPNITAKIADYRSPVQAVYEFVADPVSARDGDTVLLVKSSKDVGDTRFNRAQQYADKYNPGLTVDDIVEDPVQSEGGIVYSARDMRKAINDGDRETFLSYVPPSADADALWSTLTKKEESLDSLIDDAIEEMSTMAGGAVGGYSLPLGAKPVYPKGNKRKNKKPKVNRGKRQRRR